MRALALGLSLALLFGCSKPTAPQPLARTSAASPTSSVSPLVGLAISNELEVSGLRIKTGTLAAPPSLWGFTDVALDATKTRLQIVLAKHGAPLQALLPAAALLVVNGGYFEADFRPSTWLKDAGLELSPKHDTSKGGVLAQADGAVYLGPFAGLSFEPQLLVQSFPLIVEADGQSGIHSDDGRRAARTVACLVQGTLHFIVIAAPRGDGPTLFESAALLRQAPPAGFGCRTALNLDGGPSSGVWFAPQIAAKQRAPFAPVGYAIAVLPRAG